MAAIISVYMRARYRSFLQGVLQPDELGVDIELMRRNNEVYNHVEHAIGRSRAAQLLLDQPDELWREWLKAYMVGTSEEVVERLRQAMRHEAISEVVVQPRLSTERLPAETVMETFAQQVLPLVSSH